MCETIDPESCSIQFWLKNNMVVVEVVAGFRLCPPSVRWRKPWWADCLFGFQSSLTSAAEATKTGQIPEPVGATRGRA
jgi:hypothetical protein